MRYSCAGVSLQARLRRMSALASDPVEGFQVASEAVAAPHAKAPTATRARNKLLWQPPTLARYRFGERGLQVR